MSSNTVQDKNNIMNNSTSKKSFGAYTGFIFSSSIWKNKLSIYLASENINVCKTVGIDRE